MSQYRILSYSGFSRSNFHVVVFFSIRNEVFSGEQEKQSIFVREGDRII